MTERALPTIGVGVRTRPAAGTAVRPVVVPVTDAARTGVARREALLSTPARAGMLLGASAAVYAVTLAGISVLQHEQDAALTAANQPLADLVVQARAANDALETRLKAANGTVGDLVSTYDAIGSGIGAYQARLDELAALVADVQGSAAALPARIKLPTVAMRGAIATSSGGGGGGSAPKTTGKSGGSGH